MAKGKWRKHKNLRSDIIRAIENEFCLTTNKISKIVKSNPKTVLIYLNELKSKGIVQLHSSQGKHIIRVWSLRNEYNDNENKNGDDNVKGIEGIIG